jgi:rod shape-determining protein MreD
VTDVLFMLLVGLAALVIQTTSMAFVIPLAYKPDLILILVAWASLRMSFSVAAFFAFSAGILVDLLSGSPMGLFAIIYCLIILTYGYCHATLQLEGLAAQAVIIFMLTLASGGVVLLMRSLGGPAEFGWKAAQCYLLKSLFTGFSAVVVFPIVDPLRAGYGRLVGVY